MNYPYEHEFVRYCKTEKHYTDITMLVVTKSITNFWNYYGGSSDESVKLNDCKASDIQNYLNNLETNLGLKKNTINKYLSHIRVYFTFLYTHHLIDDYPMIEINGRKFSRKHTFTINWMDKLPEIAKIEGIHPETIFMMLGISLGYLPDQVLKLRYSDVATKINSYSLRQYLKNNVNFPVDDDPYILGKKFGGFYASDFHLAKKAMPDRELIGMDITLQNLRLSYIYSILSRKDLTDEDLLRILKVDTKSLLYYRQNMMRYNTLNEFVLPTDK
ncbi:site-specific integrase [Lactobacillus pasteurii]|uniref:Putative integrase-recombinase n=1 Tax=Lactobacillus pasteurii DSM 23907 = CRBIP 24.76 TaxID=1423790 RepID=I7LAP8_9LACO|nr:site-specific integrase [Lactobacillus pasteurii]TDG77356.1 hypothetical protein C5L33_000799 [Lactobacillus pasteurii]CCI84901.1 Putative integrase-recombinase [Lactobacillus pasteurii DSM 23907 = CRBIP 24.76]